MSALLVGAAVFLLACLIAGMVRVWVGPGEADRMQAVLLFGTTLVAMLLVLSYARGDAALVDVALVVVILAAWLSVAFVIAPEPSGRERDS